MKTFKDVMEVPNNYTGWYYNERHACKVHRVNGEVHNENGPAIIGGSGEEHWLQNGVWHRLDGPAQIFPSGEKHYFIFDESFSKEKYWKHPLVLLKRIDSILEL